MSKQKVNKVSSFFRYPGGKSKLRGEITAILNRLIDGEDVQYREPFFGGGSIGLNMVSTHGIRKLWMNDKDVGISCLWTSAIRHPDD
jgi:DNA adenine methylase